MRRAAAAATAAVLVLGGCARTADDAGLSGETWQVVALHTQPDTPGELPTDAAGKASLRFSGSSMNATTGCAPLRAQVETSPERLKLVDVEVGSAGDCFGGSRYVHDTLTSLLVPGAEFEIHMLNEREATLTALADTVDRPSIRVMAL
ncbi:hypothetical protein [Corynebacterium qintianiae]|uniref:hypothetical protein n=1 Tax=Corynebacterium qintianiae TaxID=2709392 RepID=UPI001F2A1D0E|nr:hypothetical protein [Corynebacterium qintianiae]